MSNETTGEDSSSRSGGIIATALFIVFGVPIIICFCVCCCIKYMNIRRHRPAVTRVILPSPRPITLLNQTTIPVASSSQAVLSFTAQVPYYAQQPVYKETQFSYPDAPPSYSEAIAYPSCGEPPATEVLCTYMFM